MKKKTKKEVASVDGKPAKNSLGNLEYLEKQWIRKVFLTYSGWNFPFNKEFQEMIPEHKKAYVRTLYFVGVIRLSILFGLLIIGLIIWKIFF